MGLDRPRSWHQQMFAYNPEVVHDEESGTWAKIPVRAGGKRISKLFVLPFPFHTAAYVHASLALLNSGRHRRVLIDALACGPRC